MKCSRLSHIRFIVETWRLGCKGYILTCVNQESKGDQSSTGRFSDLSQPIILRIETVIGLYLRGKI